MNTILHISLLKLVPKILQEYHSSLIKFVVVFHFSSHENMFVIIVSANHSTIILTSSVSSFENEHPFLVTTDLDRKW